MLQLQNVLKQMIQIYDEELEAFTGLCYEKAFKRKALLSQEAKFIAEVYFIKKGIIRVKLDSRIQYLHSVICGSPGRRIEAIRR